MPGFAAFKTKTMGRVHDTVFGSIVGFGDLIITTTPEDEGTARANYNVGVDTPDLSVSTSTTIRTLNGIENVPEKAGGHRYFVSNSVAYIRMLEYGGYPNPPMSGTGKTIGGFSTQAPQGMFGVSAMQWPEIVYGVARRVAA